MDSTNEENQENKNLKMSIKTRAKIIGAAILIAYGSASSMLISSQFIVMLIEIFSGLAVLYAAVLLYPLLKPFNKILTYCYTFIKFIEGSLIIVAAFVLLPRIFTSISFSLGIDETRDFIYIIIEYLFGIRFLILGILYFISKLVPRFISVWGVIGSTLMVLSVLLGLITGDVLIPFYISHIPVILNEIFLAIWLIVKGFDKKNVSMQSNLRL